MSIIIKISKFFCFLSFICATLLNAQTTETFNFTGGNQFWIVPGGVFSIDVEVIGAAGKYNVQNGGVPGKGGKVTATIPVIPGEVLQINVGGGDGSSNLGGYNGGGNAGVADCPASAGGGGGGMSDIRRSPYLFDATHVLAVAGGGGGAGGNRNVTCGPGSGGGAGAGWFGGGGGGGYDGTGGGGGTSSAGGIGGVGSFGGGNGVDGSLGTGGAGGTAPANNQAGSNTGAAGGNGGSTTGAAGATGCCGIWVGGGGGGGSSFTIAGATNIIHMQGVQSGNGLVKITYTIACPCSDGSQNGSFETSCAANNGIIFSSTFYGWTSNDAFEIWGNGREGVPAYHLSNFIEINANFPSTIHQDISTCPGVNYYWQAAHRGRLGTQTAVYEVGPVGGPYVTLATMTDGTNWQLYSGNYVIPSGQTTTRIRIRGVNGGSVGNFVDAVGFVPSISCLNMDVDGDGFSPAFGDCNDNNSNVKPCATEICNAIDDDCDGMIDGIDNNFISTDPNDPSYYDVVLPTVTCPADVNYITPNGNCGPISSSSISLGTATAMDNCIVIISLTNNAPSNYPLGNTTVKWTATDKKGNKGTCNQKVTIVPYSCGVPVQVYHTDTTTSSAKIKWKVGTCNTDYQLRIRVELSPGMWGSWSSWTNYNGGVNLEHLFSSLNDNSYYNYQIRSKCGSPTNSTVVNGWFHTLDGGALRKAEDDIVYGSHKLENYQSLPTGNGELTNVSIKTIPNPAKDFVNIVLDGFDKANKTLSMMDLLGKQVFRIQVPANENELEMDLIRLNLANGAYIIHVDDGVNRKTIQVGVQR